jgi:hypothetical protein
LPQQNRITDIFVIAGEKSVHHVQPLLLLLELELAKVAQSDLDAILSHKPQVVLCLDEYQVLYSTVLAQLQQPNIGLLLMFDGTLK